jgi:flavin reductase (DIM6/NTAB) family NADH-FMN oxidoreductase RutF
MVHNAASGMTQVKCPPPVEAAQFRKVASLWPSGVAVVTAIDVRGRPFGLTVSSVTSLSLEPPLFLVCINLTSESLSAILEGKRFCINFLSKHQKAVSSILAGKRLDKFEAVLHRKLASGQIEIIGALAVIECDVEQVISGGDHKIIIGRTVTMACEEGEPLVRFCGAFCEIANSLAAGERRIGVTQATRSA